MMQLKPYQILFNICLQNDDVRDFDTRWHQIPKGTSELPQNVVEGLYKNDFAMFRTTSNSVCNVQSRIESRSGGTEVPKMEKNGKTTH